MEATYLIDEFGRPLTSYEREKMLGKRKANGALKLKRLSPKHLKMIELHLAGWSGGAISSHFGCTRAYTSLVLNDPLAQDIISTSTEDVKKEIAALVGVAVHQVRTVMLGDSSQGAKFQAIDRLEKLHKMTDSKGAEKTAEDLVQELLARGATLNITQNNFGTPPTQATPPQVGGAHSSEPALDAEFDEVAGPPQVPFQQTAGDI
jgi:hypothetical protein